jgi:hypothetical protein
LRGSPLLEERSAAPRCARLPAPACAALRCAGLAYARLAGAGRPGYSCSSARLRLARLADLVNPRAKSATVLFLHVLICNCCKTDLQQMQTSNSCAPATGVARRARVISTLRLSVAVGTEFLHATIMPEINRLCVNVSHYLFRGHALHSNCRTGMVPPQQRRNTMATKTKTVSRSVSTSRVSAPAKSTYAGFGEWLGFGDGLRVRNAFRDQIEKFGNGRKWGSHATVTDLHRAVLARMVARRMDRDETYAKQFPHAAAFVASVKIPADALDNAKHWNGGEYVGAKATAKKTRRAK